MPDKYDEAIIFLKDAPDEIMAAWSDPYCHRAGCLFQLANGRPASNPVKKDFTYGCLTTIRALSHNVAQTEELTESIRADSRIPTSAAAITVADLPVFAEWQRRLDKELNRS